MTFTIGLIMLVALSLKAAFGRIGGLGLVIATVGLVIVITEGAEAIRFLDSQRAVREVILLGVMALGLFIFSCCRFWMKRTKEKAKSD